MKTRCPAWCDRVLISHDARANVVAASDDDDRGGGVSEEEGNCCQYNVIGSDVCMGDHKPVYLSFKMRLAPS